MTARQVLAEHIAGLRLVDNHVHGYWLTSGDRRRFENGLNEAGVLPGSCGRSSCATGVFDGPFVLIDFPTQVSKLCTFGSVVLVSAPVRPFWLNAQ